MAYTEHGHHIPESPEIAGKLPTPQTCGGIGECSTCNADYNEWREMHGLNEEIKVEIEQDNQTFTDEPVFAETFREKAERIVFDYVKARLEKTDTHVTFARDEVYVVWFVKVLQNWKALLSTSLPDGMYYEVTYDGDRGSAYLDAYKKFDNIEVVG